MGAKPPATRSRADDRSAAPGDRSARVPPPLDARHPPPGDPAPDVVAAPGPPRDPRTQTAGNGARPIRR